CVVAMPHFATEFARGRVVLLFVHRVGGMLAQAAGAAPEVFARGEGAASLPVCVCCVRAYVMSSYVMYCRAQAPSARGGQNWRVRRSSRRSAAIWCSAGWGGRKKAKATPFSGGREPASAAGPARS